MQAIVAAIAAGELNAEARLVISNNADCAALQFARDQGLAWRHISASSAGGPEAEDAAIADAMVQAGVNLVVLSGYMRKLGPAVLRRYAGRILNIHPGLLPKFGGQGMYGRRVHEAVAASGERASGATIHVVDSDYDTGPIVAQQRTPLRPGDSADEIEARVRALEPGLFVQTLKRIAEGEIALP